MHLCSGKRCNLAPALTVTAFSRLLARYPRITLAGTPIRADRRQLRGFRALPVAINEMEFTAARKPDRLVYPGKALQRDLRQISGSAAGGPTSR